MRRAISEQIRKVRECLCPIPSMPPNAALALEHLDELERLLKEEEPETPRTSRMK